MLDFSRTGLFSSDEDDVTSAEEITNVQESTVSNLIENLSKESSKKKALDGAVSDLAEGLTTTPTGSIKIQPLKYLSRLYPSVDGGLTELAEELQKNVERRKAFIITCIRIESS